MGMIVGGITRLVYAAGDRADCENVKAIGKRVPRGKLAKCGGASSATCALRVMQCITPRYNGPQSRVDHGRCTNTAM